MKVNSTAYNFVRLICGWYFILQGCAQIDFTGKRLFPNVNNFFVESYKSYVNSIPWRLAGINPSADEFREGVGCIILVAGLLFALDYKVKISSIAMCLLGVWSVYAHTLAGDATYTAVCGGVIALVMLVMAFTEPEPDHEKTD